LSSDSGDCDGEGEGNWDGGGAGGELMSDAGGGDSGLLEGGREIAGDGE